MPNPLKETPSVSSTKKDPKLRHRTKAFADTLLKDPTTTPTEAYLKTHVTENRTTAAVNSNKILKNTNVQIYMKKHVLEAKRTVLQVMDNAKVNIEKPAWQRLALDAANSVLDRQLGKATTRVESTNQNLNINVEASQELSDAFTNFLKDYTTPTN